MALIIVLTIHPAPLIVPLLVITPPTNVALTPRKRIIPPFVNELTTFIVEPSSTRNSPSLMLPAKFWMTSELVPLAWMSPPSLDSGDNIALLPRMMPPA